MENLRRTALQQQKAHFLLGNFCYWAMFTSGDFTSQRAHMPGQSSNSFVNLLPLLKPYSFTSQGWPTAPGHFTISALPTCLIQREHPRAAKMGAHTPADSQSTPSTVALKAFLQKTAASLGSHSHMSLLSWLANPRHFSHAGPVGCPSEATPKPSISSWQS